MMKARFSILGERAPDAEIAPMPAEKTSEKMHMELHEMQHHAIDLQGELDEIEGEGHRGRFIDPAILREKRVRIKKLRVTIASAQFRLARLIKQENEEAAARANRAYDLRFSKVARDLLPAETYADLMREVKAREAAEGVLA